MTTATAVRRCEGCGQLIHPTRPANAKHCDDACRVAAHRRREADADTAQRMADAAQAAERIRGAAETERRETAQRDTEAADAEALARFRLAQTANDRTATLSELRTLADQLTADAARTWRSKAQRDRLADRLADTAGRLHAAVDDLSQGLPPGRCPNCGCLPFHGWRPA